MANQEPRHPFIRINGENDEFELGYSRFGKSLEAGGISADQFRNKLNDVISLEDIRAKFAEKYFFEIELRLDYFTKIPQDLFKQLGVEVESVFGSKEGLRRVIVSGKKDTIQKYKEKSRLNKLFLNCIIDIKIIDSNEKIGESIKQNWDDERKSKITFSFLKKLSSENLEEFNNEIEEFKDQIKLGKFTSTASGFLKKSQIEKLASIPLVKRIAEPPKWKGSFIARSSAIKSPLNIKKSDNPNLPKVCVIDTGISEGLKDVADISGIGGDYYDTDGHGTTVASVCMFSRNDLITSSKLVPDVEIISHKICDSASSDDMNFFEELIAALDMHKDKANIFCFSWNCLSYDDVMYEDSLIELDQFLQKNNLLLVNSAGNLERDEVATIQNQYPKYILENPVMTPSESKYTFSVGSTHNPSPYTTILSPFTRAFLPMNVISRMEDRLIRIKPEVHAEGGFIEYGKTSNDDNYKGLICLDEACNKVNTVGTSLSAPKLHEFLH